MGNSQQKNPLRKAKSVPESQVLDDIIPIPKIKKNIPQNINDSKETKKKYEHMQNDIHAIKDSVLI
jgi:hypothetical protein